MSACPTSPATKMNRCFFSFDDSMIYLQSGWFSQKERFDPTPTDVRGRDKSDHKEREIARTQKVCSDQFNVWLPQFLMTPRSAKNKDSLSWTLAGIISRDDGFVYSSFSVYLSWTPFAHCNLFMLLLQNLKFFFKRENPSPNLRKILHLFILSSVTYKSFCWP